MRLVWFTLGFVTCLALLVGGLALCLLWPLREEHGARTDHLPRQLHVHGCPVCARKD